MLAAGRITDQFQARCNVPLVGTGSPTVFINQLAASAILDQTIPFQERVPCPTCCTTYVAPIMSGSPKVFINQISAARITSIALGITGTFPLQKGSPKVFIT